MTLTFGESLALDMSRLGFTAARLAGDLKLHMQTIYSWRGDGRRRQSRLAGNAPDAQKVMAACRAMKVPDPLRLLKLSIRERSRFEVAIDGKSDESVELAARVVEGWDRLTAEDMAEIRAVIERRLR